MQYSINMSQKTKGNSCGLGKKKNKEFPVYGDRPLLVPLSYREARAPSGKYTERGVFINIQKFRKLLNLPKN